MSTKMKLPFPPLPEHAHIKFVTKTRNRQKELYIFLKIVVEYVYSHW